MTITYIVEEEKNWLNKLSEETGIRNIEDQKYIKLKEGRVVSLFLNKLGLESIPSTVFKFRYLETLYLDHNKLDTIHEDILNLKYLKDLFISYNILKKLPDILGKLYCLRGLYYSNNPLQLLSRVLIRVKLPKIFGIT